MEKTYEQRVEELITVELLKDVLNITININDFNFYIENSEIKIIKDGMVCICINLDTFCFMCKDWVFTKGFETESSSCVQENGEKRGEVGLFKPFVKECFYENTLESEQEAIIKATLWVQKELKC